MSNKRLVIAAVVAVVIILAVIGIGVLVMGGSRGDVKIEVPDTASQVDNESKSNDETQSEDQNMVKVTPQSVQRVLAALKRPETYSRDITVTQYSGDNSVSTTMHVSVSGGKTAVVQDTQPKKHIVLTENKEYIWYDGDEKTLERQKGDVTSDQAQMMITYEDILLIDAQSITDAGYRDENGQICIYVTYTSGVLNYTTTCSISTELGLVISARRKDENGLIYEMHAGDISLEAVDNSAFTLPDGSQAQ